MNDVTPPRLRLVPTRGAVVVSATDSGSGVDPSLGQRAARRQGGHPDVRERADSRIRARTGRHTLVLTVGDYQETKNMEDVAADPPEHGDAARRPSSCASC